MKLNDPMLGQALAAESKATRAAKNRAKAVKYRERRIEEGCRQLMLWADPSTLVSWAQLSLDTGLPNRQLFALLVEVARSSRHRKSILAAVRELADELGEEEDS